MGYNYHTLRRNSSICHIFEFSPADIRFDATIGTRGRLERLSKINGEPKSDEYPIAKVNGGFFAMNGSTEFIGSFVDEGLYYQGSSYYYPTLVYWKNSNTLSVEHHATQERHAFYQKNAWWAIGVPWTLVVDGKVNYTYDRKTLIANFGHPYQRAPRTLIGQKADGTIVWVVVDGRKVNSLGFTIDHSANLMVELGCKIAVNVDGGGSSEMIVNGSIVNRPSDGCERAIGTAFMAYAKKVSPVEYEYNANGFTTVSSLNVRLGPGTGYSRTGTLSGSRTAVTIVAKNSGATWYKIKYGSGYGWVSASYISVSNATSHNATGITTASSLNIRSGAGTSFNKVGSIPRNTTLVIEASTNGWYKITYNKISGYVSASYVKIL